MKIMAKIENSIVFRALLKVEVAVLIITSVLAAAFVFAGVFLRYVLKSNFFGQEEILTVVAMWLYWMGGIYGTYENSHRPEDSHVSVSTSVAGGLHYDGAVHGIPHFPRGHRQALWRTQGNGCLTRRR